MQFGGITINDLPPENIILDIRVPKTYNGELDELINIGRNPLDGNQMVIVIINKY